MHITTPLQSIAAPAQLQQGRLHFPQNRKKIEGRSHRTPSGGALVQPIHNEPH